jgi:hypothetical protein
MQYSCATMQAEARFAVETVRCGRVWSLPGLLFRAYCGSAMVGETAIQGISEDRVRQA